MEARGRARACLARSSRKRKGLRAASTRSADPGRSRRIDYANQRAPCLLVRATSLSLQSGRPGCLGSESSGRTEATLIVPVELANTALSHLEGAAPASLAGAKFKSTWSPKYGQLIYNLAASIKLFASALWLAGWLARAHCVILNGLIGFLGR